MNLIVHNIKETDGKVILNKIQKSALLFLNMNQINIGNVAVKAVKEISYMPEIKSYMVKTDNAYLFASALHTIEDNDLYNFTMDENEFLYVEN